MKTYKYLCPFCGEIETSTIFLGMHVICGKCRREKILIDAEIIYRSNHEKI